MTKDLDWRNAHRIRLHHFANDNSSTPFEFVAPDFTHSQPPTISDQVPLGKQDRTEMRKETISRDQASRFFFDIALAGEPIQCSEEDGTCEALR